MTQTAFESASNPKVALLQKLIKIYEKVDAVEKTGHNSFQHYDYVRATNVARALRNAFREENIFARTEFSITRSYEIPAKEGVMQAVDVLCTIEFLDALTGASIISNGYGTGADKGDKAIFKAQTGATKYALRNAFLIPDEADPEATDPETGKGTDPSPQSGQTQPKRGRPPKKVENPPLAEPNQYQATDADLPPTFFPDSQNPTEKVFDDGKLKEPYRTRATKLMDSLTSGKPTLQASEGMAAGKKLINYILKSSKLTDQKDLTAREFELALKTIESLVAHETTRAKAIQQIEDTVKGVK